MILEEILRRIKFNIGTIDDIAGRALNPIVNNRNIIDQLNSQIRQYATITKGIQDIYSCPLNTNQIYITAPNLALRSEGYLHLYVIVNSVIFPMDMRGTRDVYRNFTTNPVNGVPNWFLPFHEGKNKFFGVYPTNASNANTTTTTNIIYKNDTTIPVINASTFIANDGRFTIDNEKIKYQYRDNTNFYGCVRGLENTTASDHNLGSTIIENNVIIHYARLHNPILVYDDDKITIETLSRDIEVVDEHMEGIIQAVSYTILKKLDGERAVPYKLDSSALYAQYKEEIAKGYYAGRMGTSIVSPSPQNECGIAYGVNFKY